MHNWCGDNACHRFTGSDVGVKNTGRVGIVVLSSNIVDIKPT